MTAPDARDAPEPLPMLGAAEGTPTPAPGVVVVYLKYRDPDPLEFAGVRGRLPGPIFHAAGVLLREDDAFLALGEVAHLAENPDLARQFGRDLFPAYRNVLTVPKSAIVERRDLVVRAPPPESGDPPAGGP